MFDWLKKFSVILFLFYAVNAHGIIHIVAAENVYGEVAKELGGSAVDVISILNNPNQDPHLFTITAQTAIAITKADLIIYNGADYDPWITPFIKNKLTINVAELMKIKRGDNPHIWYLPETMPVYAKHLLHVLNHIDPKHQIDFQQHLKQFMQSYQMIFKTINIMKQKFGHTSIAATEPVFNYLSDSVGLQMYGEDFQISMMNDVPPTIHQIKHFEQLLRQHKVRLLIFNQQVINPLTKQMLMIAKEEHIPVLGVKELMPSHLTYIQWMMNNLKQLEQMLT